VGLRFTGVGIPKGATIVSASVLFTADEVKTGAASVSIRGEAADSAAPFSGSGNISGRQTTSNVVDWNPPDWTTVGAAGDAQRTPDLAELIQEIVGRQGWAAGNALAFVITGSGTRTAESYNGVAAAAPLLELVYLDEPDLEDPTTPQNLRSPAQTSVSIDLAWDASSDNVGVTGYRVYGPGGTTDVAGTSHVETGLAAATAYAFQVTALDAAGNESGPSTVLNVSTTAPDTQNPSQPQNLRSPDQSGTTIDLAWDASTDNVGVTGYRVYGPSGTTDVTDTSHVETGLAPATAYGFQVSALDAAGNESSLSATLNVSTSASAPATFSTRIASGADDVEERPASGSIKTTSSDLEMVQDGTNLQVVGLRFVGVTVPPGATINSAYLQFAADESQAEVTNLGIRAELSTDAAPFGGPATYPNTRTTTAAVAWTPAAWASGDAGPAQRTPELAGLVQQVVDLQGWSAGNALVLLVDGSGKRVAEAYESGAATAAQLVIEYEQ
jgi:chitodextrinase